MQKMWQIFSEDRMTCGFVQCLVKASISLVGLVLRNGEANPRQSTCKRGFLPGEPFPTPSEDYQNRQQAEGDEGKIPPVGSYGIGDRLPQGSDMGDILRSVFRDERCGGKTPGWNFLLQ